MLLKGTVRLSKKPNRFFKDLAPWVYSNELEVPPEKFEPGAWVNLENFDGQILGYGFYNPHSLIAFRIFERNKFRNLEQTRALFFKRLDRAYQTRTRCYGSAIAQQQMGAHSFRLVFGESDGLPGLIVDLFEGVASNGVAVIQCHAAGADQFIFWTQQWLAERLAIDAGVVRNDLEVRKKENAKQEVISWGVLPSAVFALENGIKFFIDPAKGQKTGYFYDHRDNRTQFMHLSQALTNPAQVLDCFSFMGSWGLPLLKQHPKLRLTAIDISKDALAKLLHNAEANQLRDRVEVVEADFFKDKNLLANQKFALVVADPPALTSSAKQFHEGKKAHENCFARALTYLADDGIIAFASCSFHLDWPNFLNTVQKAGLKTNRALKLLALGGQAYDHPILANLLETQYLKCAFAEHLW